MDGSQAADSQSLKTKYLGLLRKMRQEKENLAAGDDREMEALIQSTESLFEQIKKPWDLKLDAKLSTESAKISSERFERHCMSDRMTTEKFVGLVLQHRTIGCPAMEQYMQFAKEKFLGVEFAQQLCLRPAAKSSVQRQRDAPRAPETAADFPLRIFSAEDDDGTLAIVKKIRKVVCEEGPVDYYRLVLDPGSYPRTVENIFYLAFALKVGLVHFQAHEGRFLVTPEPCAQSDDLNHLVTSIEYGEYCTLVEKMGIREPLLR